MKKLAQPAPRIQSVLFVLAALQAHVPCENFRYYWRRSEKGVLNMRCEAETNGLNWIVDIYLGHFYRASVGTETGEVHRSIPSLLGFIRRQVGIPLE